MRHRTGLLVTAALLLPASLLTGCAEDIDEPTVVPTSSATVAGQGATSEQDIATGIFTPYAEGIVAVTYDPELAPAGSTATVTVLPAADSTSVRLSVSGFPANRAYGAHLHVKPCGPAGDAAGPHYQHQADPAAQASPPSVDPDYANPRNEVWLDFTTGPAGNATAASDLAWRFDPARTPKSLIIHAQTTKTGPGEAGAAGARIACLTLPG